MISIKQAIVVEGKYDKIKLSSVVDAVILVTNGFRIYKNPEQLNLIRYSAKTTGVILLTDSDRAGFQIRNYLKGAISEVTAYHVYIPDIYGKERRKVKPSAEGKLGVEGINPKTLLAVFEKAGVTAHQAPSEKKDPITNLDLYQLGLSGGAGSKQLRTQLQKQLNLPDLLSTASLLDVLNTMLSKEELAQLVDQLEAPTQ